MKFHKCVFYILFFTTFFAFSQNKDTSLIEDINLKLKKALSLTATGFEYQKSLKITLECLKQADSIKNDSLLGKSYLTNGIINSYLGRDKQALQNHRKAETIFLRTKNYKYLGSVYNNIGWNYSINKKSLDSIILYYKKALVAYSKSKDNRRIANALNNLGYKYIEINKLDESEVLLKQALELNLKKSTLISVSYALSYNYISLCELYLKKQDIQQALKYANLAEEIALLNKYDKTLLNAYNQKSKIFYAKKDHINAHKYLKKYHEMLKVVHENETSKLTQEMSAKFEVKEHKISIEKENTENNIKEEKLKRTKLFLIIIATFLVIAFLVVFLLSINNKLKFENNKLLKYKHRKLKDLQLKTELIFLRSQIQPHFFFNTLNNLYALIIDKSDKAESVVNKLSELMKYIIYNSKKIRVPIQQEIDNIKNYLELENLRYQKISSSNIVIEGEIDNIKVPSLLYITFIENCFKHNIVNDENFKLFILFKKIDSKYLFFNAQNTLIEKNESQKNPKSGIGIKNIKRRLHLIYKDEFKLDISTNNNMYSVELKIPIKIKSNF